MGNSLKEGCGSQAFVKCVCHNGEAATLLRTYLDLVWVPPVLLEYALGRHVAREDHHVVVALPARQLTLLACT